VIANDSSSSATNPLELDLAAGGRLPPIPTALLAGRDRDLLEPLRFLPPGELPGGPAPEVGRSELARALATANAAYGHPRAEELAAKLADPATRVVVTGQQPGVYGGPLLTLSKMAATVLWAEAIEAAGEPAVAVFWVATEDHDWAEATTAALLAPDGLRELDLGDDPSPLLPLGMRTLGEGIVAMAERMGEVVGGDEAGERLQAAGGWYRSDARLGEAFCRLSAHFLGERAPLFLDSMLAEVKQLERPFMERLVERRDELDEALAAADREVEERGYPLQVTPQPGLSPLFLLRGGERRRIEWRGDDRYGLRGVDDFEAPVEQLRRTLAENPAVVSPGVLARPAIQDALLGTTLQVMGPSELSYMAQARAVYPLLGIDAPWTTLRPQALVLDQRHADHLRELGVSLGELFERPVDELVAERLGDDPVAPVRERIGELLDGLGERAVELDKNLERPFAKTRDHVDRSLETFAGKVASAISRRHGVWRNRLEKLRETALPGGTFQERKLSTIHFWARHGPGFVDLFLRELDRDPRRLSVVEVPPDVDAGRSGEGGGG